MSKHRETPVPFINPSGEKVWKARWTRKDGTRRYGWAKPHGIAGTYKLKREAQAAIDRCYEIDEASPVRHDLFGNYAATWTTRHPRADKTNRTNDKRLKAVLDVDLDGLALREWPMGDLRRRHATSLVDVMLREQGRAHTGALNIIRTLAAMTEDAITDEIAVVNPWRGVKIRANDPRIQKQVMPVRVWSWDQMHAVASAAALSDETEFDTRKVRLMAEWRAVNAEPMLRTLSDGGLRIGELFGIRRSDLDLKAGLVEIRQTVSDDGTVLAGTKTDHNEQEAGRVVPVPPALAGMLKEMLASRPTPLRPDPRDLLFPDPEGYPWLYDRWYARVWKPAVRRAELDPRPHEFRHSFVTLMRAAGVPDADLAAITGHSVLTMVGRYSHSLGRSFDQVREAVGA